VTLPMALMTFTVTLRDLERRRDLAKDADEVSQHKNAELKQTIRNKEQQLEVPQCERVELLAGEL